MEGTAAEKRDTRKGGEAPRGRVKGSTEPPALTRGRARKGQNRGPKIDRRTERDRAYFWKENHRVRRVRSIKEKKGEKGSGGREGDALSARAQKGTRERTTEITNYRLSRSARSRRHWGENSVKGGKNWDKRGGREKSCCRARKGPR